MLRYDDRVWERLLLDGRRQIRTGLAFVLPAILVTAAGFSAGGFTAVSYGWIGLSCAVVAATSVLVEGAPRLTLGATLLLAAFACFFAWTVLSNLWSGSVPSTMLEVQRSGTYLALLISAALLVRRADEAKSLVGGAVSGAFIICAYSELTRLLPDRIGKFDSATAGYRLYTPITYWNGLGMLAAAGLLAALAFAIRGQTILGRVLASASLPTFSLVLLFTYSRGAWAGVVGAFLFGFIFDPRRSQLIVSHLLVIPASAVLCVIASTFSGLTTARTPLGLAAHDGHRLLMWLLAATAVSAISGCLLSVGSRWNPPRFLVLAFNASLVVCSAIACGVAIAAWGAPWKYPSRAWAAFGGWSSTPPTDVQTRLFQLSGTGRLYLWRVAWRSFTAHPWGGTGANTFWETWLRHRPIALGTTQAHNLYVQVLGELGLPGFCMLIGFIGLPPIVAIRNRRDPLSVPLAGAFVAWAIHLGVDWDWQLPGVSAVPLVVGVAVVSMVPGRHVLMRFIPTVALSLAIVGFVAWLLIGAVFMNRAKQEVVRGDLAAALADAMTTTRVAPWTAESHRVEAQTFQARGQPKAARAELLKAVENDPKNWQLWAELTLVTRGVERERAEKRVMTLLSSPYSRRSGRL